MATPRPARFNLSFLRRRRRLTDPPGGINYEEETLAMAHARRQYEEEAGSDFDELVGRESGTFGWETFNLIILSVGGVASSILGALSGMAWLAYFLGGFSALCIVMILGRWYSVRRERQVVNRHD